MTSCSAIKQAGCSQTSGLELFGGPMAKNTGKNFRKGSVDDRTQLDLDVDPKKEKFVKRDTDTGRFTDLKEDDKPFKGVAQEPDERRE